MSRRPPTPLIAVIGPTGSGKSELGLRLAEEFHGEIVNCDSLQVYRHFDIGTAKLPVSEQKNVTHHLMDFLEPDVVFTAGEYARLAQNQLEEIVGRTRLPVIVGGTGFYLRALLDGLSPGPTRDERVRKRLARREQKRPGSLHRLLSRFDPASARRIHSRDTQKLIRALEVRLLARQPLSETFGAGRTPLQGFRTLKLGLNPPREALYQRLNLRCQSMFESGLVEEVTAILARGISPQVKPFESIGYRQVLQMINGELDLQQAIASAQQETRRYSKRQLTWFRREKDVEWHDGFGDQPATQAAALERGRAFLASLGESA